jgi:hypothetical protein
MKIDIFRESSMKTGVRKRASNGIQLTAFLAKYTKYINTSRTLQGIMVW